MSGNHRNRYTAAFKTKAVLELLTGQGTLAEVASKYQIVPTMLSKWKQVFLLDCSKVFEDPRKKNPKVLENETYI
jgi:transposase-like protein